MRLQEWLSEEGIKREAFAADIGVTAVAVSRYCSGARMPDRETMRRIYQLTRGAVDPNSFYDLPRIEPVQLDIVEMTQRAIEREAREAREAAA